MRSLVVILTEKPIATDRILFIDYVDSNFGIETDNSSLPHHNVNANEHSLSFLLLALQIIRDDLDAALYLQSDLREHRLQEFAIASKLNIERFRALAVQFSAIQKFLTA